MLGFIPGDTLRRLVKQCADHFDRQGWTLSPKRGLPSDLLVKKDQLAFNLALVDESVVRQKGLEQLLAEMDFHAAKFHGHPMLCFVTDFELPEMLRTAVGARGLVAVGLQELDRVSGLRHDGPLVADRLEPREALLLRSNPWGCIHIALACKAAGDAESAIGWAKAALSNAYGFSGVYFKVFDVLLDCGDLAGAETVGLAGLDLRKNEPRLISSMQRLAAARGDTDQLAHWKRRAAEIAAAQPTPTIEAILGRKPPAASGPAATAAEGKAVGDDQPRRRFSLSGLFKSDRRT